MAWNSLAVNKKDIFKGKVWWYNYLTGYRVSASDDAYLVIRGLRTLDVRLERHQKNTNTKLSIGWLKKREKN